MITPMTVSRRKTPDSKTRRRGALSARALGFAQGDGYTATEALAEGRDDVGTDFAFVPQLAAGPADVRHITWPDE
jgi:hypothetical protein